MNISELTDTNITDELIDKILFDKLGSYNGQSLDAAIVLGSSKAHIYRLPPVIKAYKERKVNKIITSGHTRIIDGQYINEGEFLRDIAVQNGVDCGDVFVENKAKNTFENIVFSKDILLHHGLIFPGSKIGIATSTYHMRRSMLIAEKVFENNNVDLISIPGEDTSTQRETWYKSLKGKERCYEEIHKIIWSFQTGIIKDREI